MGVGQKYNFLKSLCRRTSARMTTIEIWLGRINNVSNLFVVNTFVGEVQIHNNNPSNNQDDTDNIDDR